MQYYDLDGPFKNALTKDDFYINEKGYIYIHNPINAMSIPPVQHSRRSLEEHIEYINKNHIERAVIVAEDISFISCCPSLNAFRIAPARSAKDFDITPIYEHPEVIFFCCETEYGFRQKKEDVYQKLKIDYSRIKGLKYISAFGDGHYNINKVKGLKELHISKITPRFKTFEGMDVSNLDAVTLEFTSLKTLSGLENTDNLNYVALRYNRNLEDISALEASKDTLKYLIIDKCPNINDLSILHKFHNLEYLELRGKNTVDDVSFLKNMCNLNEFIFYMKSLDGDMSLCDRIEKVNLETRKHYNRTHEFYSHHMHRK